MENLSAVNNRSISLKIEIRDYIRDHQFAGKIVLPAVEVMQILASSLQSIMPNINPSSISGASFSRFIQIDSGQNEIDVSADFEFSEKEISAVLSTCRSSKDGSIKRRVENARLVFNLKNIDKKSIPPDTACIIEGPVTEIEHGRLYEDAVPFLKNYRNAVAGICISKNGAMGTVSGGSSDFYPGPLGSPFTLDAAFHIACLWGQRYAGFTGFPVGFASRTIHHQTEKNELYHARIVPLKSENNSAWYDIYIYNMEGVLMESVSDLKMSDASSGKLKVPVWITSRLEDEKRLYGFFENYSISSIIEIGRDAPFSYKIFSDFEKSRWNSMGERRKKSFTAARLACKSIFRKSNHDYTTAPEKINTVRENYLPACGNSDKIRCSLSHDSRFAAAVSSEKFIGVDVEEISDRVNRTRAVFMNESEISVTENSKNPEKAALKIWSVKECAVKAFGINLTDSWKEVIVTDLNENNSSFSFKNKIYNAEHFEYMNHLFTIVIA